MKRNYLRLFFGVTILLLLLTLHAQAQQSTPAKKKYTEISFTKSDKSIEELTNSLEVASDSYIPTRPGDEGNIYTAIIQNKNKDRLYFVARRSAYFCGTSGCSLEAYLNTGKGYKNSLSAIAFPVIMPTYISEDWKSLLLCGTTNGIMAEWRLNAQTGIYNYVGHYKGKDVNPC